MARARDIASLAILRAGLRDRMRQSPLCDAPRFGAGLGSALRHIWRDRCDRQLDKSAAIFLKPPGPTTAAHDPHIADLG